MCTRTVCSDRNSRSAISCSVSPAASRAATMHSLLVSPNSEASTPASITERVSELPTSTRASGDFQAGRTASEGASGVAMNGTGRPSRARYIHEPAAPCTPMEPDAWSISFCKAASWLWSAERRMPPSSDRRSSSVTMARTQAFAYFTRMPRSMTITPKSSVSSPAMPSAASSLSSWLRCCMRAARCRCGSTRSSRCLRSSALTSEVSSRVRRRMVTHRSGVSIRVMPAIGCVPSAPMSTGVSVQQLAASLRSSCGSRQNSWQWPAWGQLWHQPDDAPLRGASACLSQTK